MSKRIAYIHYPYGPKSARLETMPFSLNSVLELARVGWEIDLYLWERPSRNYASLLPKNVRIYYSIESRYNLFNNLRPDWFRFRYHWCRNYYCVFGLGQIGAYIGSLMAKASQCPFVYLNDEFPSHWNNPLWEPLERQAVKEAILIVVPDAQRFQPLCQELQLSITTPHVVLPNIPIVHFSNKPIDWHKRLKLPKGSIPFLYAGSVTVWAQVPELLKTVPYWPELAVLVVNSRSKREIETFWQQYSHLKMSDRIFWSDEPLPENLLNSLVSYCEGNFALYCNTGPNIELVGFSSGKLMRSLACGCPVIATELSSFEFIRKYQLGVLIRNFAEIPDAIKQIMGNREAYRRRCLDFCETHASFKLHWQNLCQTMIEVAQIDLCKPTRSP
ncbi:MAG: hypothetical protein IGR93_12595 [Hydrococcus sp. C42_A2020_068]|nr:hypothetical protein [Hydrococcus sp. C42_A2020_068]